MNEDDRAALVHRVREEFSRLEENARHSSQNQFAMCLLWRAAHRLMSGGSAVLAAVSGAGALADLTSVTTAGWIALSAAATAAIATALSPQEHAERAREVADRYLVVQRKARQSRDMGHCG